MNGCLPTRLSVPRSPYTVYYLAFVMVCSLAAPALATDYFLAIGGGYSPEGNQASLEANVLFFQQVLRTSHRGPSSTSVFFADGYNAEADLQVADDQPSQSPATDLLTSIFTFGGSREKVYYRNHRVANIAGPNSPDNIKASLARITKNLTQGDRLFVYVTAHGSAGGDRNPYNTSINCWDNKKVFAKQFAGWLDDVPATVPTVLIMAQCYCGGFAHAIFNEHDPEQGLAENIRVGFFAQQHDLAAAGCRPDIKNDEEYSSYFWGALAGQSRTGRPIAGCDYDQDGMVSFAEAHSYAVIESSTIDIPLRTSEEWLRWNSRIRDYDHRRDTRRRRPNDTASAPAVEADDQAILGMTGSISSIADRCRPEIRATITGLSEQLGLKVEQEVTDVFAKFEDRRRAQPMVRRGRGRSSGRRILREQVLDEWPELSDRETWRDSPLLSAGNQEKFLGELKALPAYEAFEQSLLEREKSRHERELAEVERAKFQRLVNALEYAILAENLEQIASPEEVHRFQQMVAMEEAFLSP
ncbi:MAG: hypothetical protein KDB22_28810 [Planctomycetales bacterium]|nr:hypothetical protein [Planctomycetales bacterium]